MESSNSTVTESDTVQEPVVPLPDITLSDKYTRQVLEETFKIYKDSYMSTSSIIERTGIKIRHQNPPEDVTENMVKFIVRNYDNDPTCMWAKDIGKKGDLFSTKCIEAYQPEVKAFTSSGPSQFSPTKKFGYIYFLNMMQWLNNKFILWRMNLSSESQEWKSIKMNKIETNADQCKQGRRPHLSFEKIYEQIPQHCVKVYEGTFEDMFIPRGVTE